MSRTTVVLCFPVNDNQVNQIRTAAGPDVDVVWSDQEKIVDDIFKADIFCGHVKIHPVDWQSVVEQGRLKWIQSSAAGLDHCLHPPVIESDDIVVSGCSGLFADQVAEQTLALTFGLKRSLHTFFRAQQQREFIRRPTDTLHGKTVGILGMGGNGHRLARVFRPIAGQIIGTDRFPEACDKIVSEGALDEILPHTETNQVFERSDVTIAVSPLSDETHQSIGEEQFALAGGKCFINIGRGSTVNQSDLETYLLRGHLAGVGLDVVDPEPLPADSPLWEQKNVIITPHVGAQSEHRVPRTVDFFCENLARYQRGKPLLNRVDKRLGFPRPEHRIEF